MSTNRPLVGDVPMQATVTIPSRFVGPPDSAHGGYACGVVAAAVGNGPVEVTLRRPPPVDRPLQLVSQVRGAELRDGDLLVAEAVEADPVVDLPRPIPLGEARRAAERLDAHRYAASHPFPTCFACGPGREAGDGLRIFPAPAAPHQVVWPWVPDDSLAAADGHLASVYLWAALDCPSGLAWIHDEPEVGPHVLGRMTATVHRRPSPGDELVVAGWLIAVEGRKRRSGAVVWDARGGVVAEALALWIALDVGKQAQFRTAG